jgi:hypothetical protein
MTEGGSGRPRFECPSCHEARVEVSGFTEDAKTELRCLLCDHRWVHGAVQALSSTRRPRALTRDQALTEFSATTDVPQSVQDRVEVLKVQFLQRWPDKESDVDEYWVRYQRIFASDGLPEAEPKDLKSFANTTTGAHPGNMSVFNRAWNEMGDETAARHLRNALEYLLRGPDEVPIEDRLSRLIDPQDPIGMTGFRESLLTKVLCVVYPARFVPILLYSSPAGGKREIAAAVFGLDLPMPDHTSWTRGRLAFWSNDLLVKSVGTGLIDNQHMAQFLWWAKDQTAASTVS